MKTIFNKTAIAALSALVLTACTPESFDSPCEADIPISSDYEDNMHVSVDQETNTATFSFDAVEGVTPVWIIDGSTYSSEFSVSKYYRKAGEYSVQMKVKNANGISDGILTKTFTIDKTKMSGFGGFVYESDYNLWTKATIGDIWFYYAPGWSKIADPAYTYNNGTYTINLPQATTDQWQAQMHMPTDISTTAEKSYDFSVILTSQEGHNGVTVKLTDASNDDNYFCADKVTLEAGEPKCYYFSDVQGIDAASLKLVFDFGGNAAGDVINVENIVFKDHANDDGTEVPAKETETEPAWVDENSAANLWHNSSQKDFWFYYAPDWNQIGDPKVAEEDGVYSISLPTATYQQWQAQVHITTDISTDATTPYDFCVTLNSNTDIANATVKLVETDETAEDGTEKKHDGNSYFVKNLALTADTNTKVWAKSALPAEGACHQLKLVLDFGGNPANTVVKVSKIIMQKHQD